MLFFRSWRVCEQEARKSNSLYYVEVWELVKVIHNEHIHQFYVYTCYNWFSKIYCCYSYSLKLPFTSMCILDILHFAILNTHVQHPTHISHHSCKITWKDKALFYFIVSFYFILLSRFKKYNWLSLQVNTHTHTIFLTIYNTISTRDTSSYMRKRQKKMKLYEEMK